METITIGAQIKGANHLFDGTIRLSLDLQELTRVQQGKFFELFGKFCFVAFKEEDFTRGELDSLKGLKGELKGASQSLKVKQVLYRLWQKDNEGLTDEQHYQKWTNTFINHIKDKLDG